MSYIDKIPIVKEMMAVGLGNTSIIIFSTLGLVIWGILTWLFSMRINNLLDETGLKSLDVTAWDNTDPFSWLGQYKTDPLRNISVIILVFHVVTLFLTILESRYLSKNVWISWFTIGLAVSAIFLNASSVAIIIVNENINNENMVGAAIASLVLQCMGVSLMTAYLFKLIRSRKKTIY